MSNYTSDNKKVNSTEISNYSTDIEKLSKQIKSQPIQKSLKPIIKKRKKFLKFALCGVLYLLTANAFSLIPQDPNAIVYINDGGAQPCPDDENSHIDYPEETIEDEETLLP